MKQIILLLLIIFNCSYSLAQNAGSLYREISPFEQARRLQSHLGAKNTAYNGTPYHKPNYLIGSIYRGDNLLSNSVALRYNIFADEIEVKLSIDSPDSEAQMLLESSDIFVQINGDVFSYMYYNGEGGYFQVLAEGQSINLYKKIIKKYFDEKKPSQASPRGKLAFFKDKFTYYLVDNKGKFHETTTSKKKILKFLSDNDGNLKKFIKENKINFKKEKDFVKFIDFHNSI